MKTSINYHYADAGSWKHSTSVCIPGTVTHDQINEILDCLTKDGMFIPMQLGFPHAGVEMEGFPNDDDDHCWHTITGVDFVVCGDFDTTKITHRITPDELVALFKKANKDGWDDAKYGIPGWVPE